MVKGKLLLSGLVSGVVFGVLANSASLVFNLLTTMPVVGAVFTMFVGAPLCCLNVFILPLLGGLFVGFLYAALAQRPLAMNEATPAALAYLVATLATGVAFFLLDLYLKGMLDQVGVMAALGAAAGQTPLAPAVAGLALGVTAVVLIVTGVLVLLMAVVQFVCVVLGIFIHTSVFTPKTPAKLAKAASKPAAKAKKKRE